MLIFRDFCFFSEGRKTKDESQKTICRYDNVPIVEEMQAKAKAKAKWSGFRDFRQKNKDKRQCVNVPIVELVFACAFAFVCLNSNLRTRNRTRNSKPETRNSEPETQNPEPETRTPNPVTICEINCNYKLFFVLSHIVNTLQNKLIEHEYRFSKIRRPGTSNYTR